MTGTIHPVLLPPKPVPGLGPGWAKVAAALAEQISADSIDRIWVFAPLRRDDKEWGTAVVSRRADQGRVEVFTVQYMVLTRGKKRGQGRVEIQEVAESPESIVLDVVHGVQRRSGESDAPIEIDSDLWFPKDDDEPAAEG